MIPDNKLDFWIANNLNVILRGKHGTGKSTVVLEAFQRHNLKFKYFSASTMDPWVDFIGVPKEKKDGDVTYLELIRPKEFQDDSIEAIFFDEFNRSSKKIRNAVMELIQFKSINGKKFNNLKMIWAAINPEKDEADPDNNLEYDVEKLDPAQLDRFHIIYDVPYKLDKPYFSSKYGPVLSDAINIWWNKLPNNVKEEVSPRRMDYLIDIYNKKGDIKDVIGKAKINVSELIRILQSQDIMDLYNSIWKEKNSIRAKEFLSDMNNVDFFMEKILKKTGVGDHSFYNFWLPCMQQEKLAALVFDSKHGVAVKGWIFDKNIVLKSELIQGILSDWYISKSNSDLFQKSQAVIEANINEFANNDSKKTLLEFLEKNKKKQAATAALGKLDLNRVKSKYNLLGGLPVLITTDQFTFEKVEANTYSKMIRLAPMLDSVLSFDANDPKLKANLMETVKFTMNTFQVATATRKDMANYNIAGKPKDYHFGATFLSYVLYALEINGIESISEIEPENIMKSYFRSKMIRYFKAIEQKTSLLNQYSDKKINAVIINNPYAQKLLSNLAKETNSQISESEEIANIPF